MTARQRATQVYKMAFGNEKAKAVWELDAAAKKELLKLCRPKNRTRKTKVLAYEI